MKGYIEERGERTFRVHVHLGYDAAGKRRRKVVTVHGTRKDAEKKLAELLHEAHQGAATPTTRLTVAQYLDYWLANYANRLAARTTANYAEYVTQYLKPGLGRVRLESLMPADIQAFYTQLQQTGGRGGKPLSATTVFNTHRVFKGALRRAVQWQMLAKNPADAVTPPAPCERPPRVLSPEQVARLLEAAGPRLYLPILIALCTGLRRGEICGLRWQDVSLERKLLAIRQTLVRVSPGNLQYKPPKTRAGRRTVAIPALLIGALQAERAAQQEHRQMLGSTYNERELVVCREDGRPFDPATLYSSFQQLLVRLGLERMALHDLRHSHATLLLESGVHPKIVSERLGHSSVQITLDTYSHVLENIQQEAAERTDQVLRSAIERRGGDSDTG